MTKEYGPINPKFIPCANATAAPVEEVARAIASALKKWPQAFEVERDKCITEVLRQHGYGAQPRLQIIEVREVKPSNAPDRHVVFLGNHVIASFYYEHEAEALKVNLEAALGAQGQGVGPRCPKGGGTELTFQLGSDLVGWLGKVFCKCCTGEFSYHDIEDWTDFAQFFSPIPSPESATPQHGICPNCGADRSGPSVEAHAANCPENIKEKR